MARHVDVEVDIVDVKIGLSRCLSEWIEDDDEGDIRCSRPSLLLLAVVGDAVRSTVSRNRRARERDSFSFDHDDDIVSSVTVSLIDHSMSGNDNDSLMGIETRANALMSNAPEGFSMMFSSS